MFILQLIGLDLSLTMVSVGFERLTDESDVDEEKEEEVIDEL